MTPEQKTKRNEILASFQQEDARQISEDIKAVMQTAPGRRLFMTILFAGGIYSHTQHDDDVKYLAGRRDAALEILKAVSKNVSAFELLARKERADLVAERNRYLKETTGSET